MKISAEDAKDALETLAQYGVPMQGATGLLDVGSDAFLRYFEKEVLDEFVSRGGATCKIFEGPYGSGKTHLLHLIQELSLARGYATVRADLSQALSLHDWHLITRHILENLEFQGSEGTVKSLPRVIQSLARTDLATPDKVSPANLPHPGFARAILLLAREEGLTRDGRAILSRFLMGERVTAMGMKDAGVTGVRNPLTLKNAEFVLRTVLATLHQLGLPGTIVLFDENEHTFSAGQHSVPKRVINGANLLRRLIDATSTGGLLATAIVFAVLPGFVTSCSLAYPALGQRLHVKRNGSRIGWRSPVLNVDTVTTATSPEQFLELVVVRTLAIMDQLGVPAAAHGAALRAAGKEVLAANAGSGYKRALVKRLAAMSLMTL